MKSLSLFGFRFWIVVSPQRRFDCTLSIIYHLQTCFKFIVVVNDGSTDRTKKILENLDITLINHSINLGQGGAIKTGVDYILKYTEADAIITFDADGQHMIEDAIRFSQKILTTDKDIIFVSTYKITRWNQTMSRMLSSLDFINLWKTYKPINSEVFRTQ